MAGALVITTDTSLGSLVRRAMSGSGVDVAVAKDSDAATRALVTMRVDAVVTDALWPEDVTEARRLIASTGRDVPLAVIAGEATRWNRWRLPRGAVQVFRRPLDLREVRQALQLLVRGKPAAPANSNCPVASSLIPPPIPSRLASAALSSPAAKYRSCARSPRQAAQSSPPTR